MIGRTLSHYKLHSKLGRGGMGEVYLAEDTRLKRQVALKLLPADVASDPERLARFQREAELLAKLEHPNIVTIYSVEEAEGVRFLTMERVGGRGLDEFIPPGGLPVERVLEIAAPIARALAAAHDRGVIHRDLKPANVRLADDGTVKLLDFGLARPLAPDPGAGSDDATLGMTREGTMLGTVPYMAPEQARGEAVDPRSDVFALGILLYEMATGARPFDGRTGADVVSAILRVEPPALLARRPELPRQLGRIVGRCLKKEPEARFQTCRDVANELEELAHELREEAAPEVAGPTVGPPAPGAGRSRRRGLAIAAGLLGGAALAALGVALWLGRGRVEEPPATGAPAAAASSVAVVPFSNRGAGEELDYLRLAVPDEITTVLSHVPSLVVRPFAESSSDAVAVPDPRSIGRALGVAHVVTGQLLAGGAGRLRLSLEAVEVATDRVAWRETLEAPVDDLLTLYDEVSERVRAGLLPALGAAAAGAAASRPENAEAYELYLRTLAASRDPTPNRQALQMLERAVALDPGFASAWSQLGLRYRWDAVYSEDSEGVEEHRARSDEALRRARELDPSLVEPAAALILVRVESGDLQGAWAAARDLVAQRPDQAAAYFSRAYVARYGGAYEASNADCERALALDPLNQGLRSCAFNFALSGDPAGAGRFLRLVEGSEWARDSAGHLELFAGDPAAALAHWRQRAEIDPWDETRLLELHLEGGDEAALAAAAERSYALYAAEDDVEMNYIGASTLATVGHRDRALALLEQAIEGGYCAFPAVDHDRSWDRWRDDPGFQALRRRATACRDDFLRRRSAPGG